jgi:hypothetical protein
MRYLLDLATGAFPYRGLFVELTAGAFFTAVSSSSSAAGTAQSCGL